MTASVTRIGSYRVTGPGTDTIRHTYESAALAYAKDVAEHAEGMNLWYVLWDDEPIYRIVRGYDNQVHVYVVTEGDTA